MLYTSMWMRLQKAFSFGTKFNSNADIRQAYVLFGAESIVYALYLVDMPESVVYVLSQRTSYMFNGPESVIYVVSRGAF